MNFIRTRLSILLYSVAFVGFSQSPFNYEIKGEIKGLQNDTLYLNIMFSNSKKSEQIKIAASNDKFSYKGQANIPAIVWAQTTAKRSDNGNFTFFIEDGKIEIEGNNEDLTHTKVTGTPANNDYNYTMSKMNNYYDRRTTANKKLLTIKDTSSAAYKNTFREMVALTDSVAVFNDQYVATHPNSLASGMLLMLIADNIPVSRLEEYYNNLGDNVKQLSILSKMPVKIEGRKRSVIGSPAPDFTMNDVNGKPVTLSDYRGKYVLLDFWASWCVPCRQDNPFVKAAYEKFRDKNFTVIGVSLDENGEKWKEAVEKDQLPWTHVSDLKKPNEVAELYGVQPIPDNFLIDPSGKIIERGLHGDDLERKLSSILK